MADEATPIRDEKEPVDYVSWIDGYADGYQDAVKHFLEAASTPRENGRASFTSGYWTALLIVAILLVLFRKFD